MHALDPLELDVGGRRRPRDERDRARRSRTAAPSARIASGTRVHDLATRGRRTGGGRAPGSARGALPGAAVQHDRAGLGDRQRAARDHGVDPRRAPRCRAARGAARRSAAATRRAARRAPRTVSRDEPFDHAAPTSRSAARTTLARYSATRSANSVDGVARRHAIAATAAGRTRATRAAQRVAHARPGSPHAPRSRHHSLNEVVGHLRQLAARRPAAERAQPAASPRPSRARRCAALVAPRARRTPRPAAAYARSLRRAAACARTTRRAGAPARAGCRSSPGRPRSRRRTGVDANGSVGACVDARQLRRQDRADRPRVDRAVGVAAGALVDRADVQARRAADAVQRLAADLRRPARRCGRCRAARGGTRAARRPRVTPVHSDVYGFIRSPVDERGRSWSITSRSRQRGHHLLDPHDA